MALSLSPRGAMALRLRAAFLALVGPLVGLAGRATACPRLAATIATPARPHAVGAATSPPPWRANCDRSVASEKKLGVFLSEARLTGEIMQQELTSMIPVAVMTAYMDKQTFSKGQDLRFLDLCAAPGSKTCQLLSALERRLQVNESTSLDISPSNRRNGVDFTIVANELSPQRASWMQHRLHQQSGSSTLSNLIITCADGREFAKMKPNSVDYVVCDVPCSGDGTVRKSPKILGKWSSKKCREEPGGAEGVAEGGVGAVETM